nr:MAG TPA: hypothetical protein [Caudoviricetes sp.]
MYRDFMIFALGILTSFMLIIIFGEIHDRYGNTPSNREKRKYIENRMKDVCDALKIAFAEMKYTSRDSL